MSAKGGWYSRWKRPIAKGSLNQKCFWYGKKLKSKHREKATPLMFSLYCLYIYNHLYLIWLISVLDAQPMAMNGVRSSGADKRHLAVRFLICPPKTVLHFDPPNQDWYSTPPKIGRSKTYRPVVYYGPPFHRQATLRTPLTGSTSRGATKRSLSWWTQLQCFYCLWHKNTNSQLYNLWYSWGLKPTNITEMLAEACLQTLANGLWSCSVDKCHAQQPTTDRTGGHLDMSGKYVCIYIYT